ncbi:MAG TPA: alpha/beta hydrolase, partial [Actinomycetota bacterium]|nr:alpha/beta hydrolase [Actinomycetota bacterium]
SMGGMAILSLAALHPEEFGGRVVGVVLANTAAADLVKETLGGLAARAVALLRAAARPSRVGWILRQAGGPGSDLAFLVARATNFGPGAPASLIDHVTRISVGTPVEVWTDLLGSLMEMDLRHAMEHVRVPALVLAGDVDRLTPQATAAVLRRGLPDARVMVFRGAGHCAMLERHEEFNQVVEGFVHDLAPRGRRERAPA